MFVTNDAAGIAPPALGRIQAIGRIGRALAFGAIAVALAGTVWVWSDPVLIEGLARRELGLGAYPIALTLRGRMLALAVSLVPLGLFVFGMANVAGLFGRFARGRVFDLANTAALTRIGWTMVLAALAGPVVRALAMAALTLDNPPGQRVVAIGLGTDQITALVTGIGVLALAAVLREAIRLADENRGFV